MSSTFDIFSIKSVPSTYSWDKGTPTLDYNEFITELSACSATNSTGQTEYVGYAPFVFVSLSSAPGDISDTFLALKRVADFGDYYNSDSNIVTVPSLSNELLCHCYVMPGLYSVQFQRTEFIEAAAIADFTPFGSCLQKHCIDWSWKSLSNCTTELSVTWATSLSGNSYEKKWKFEPCEAEWALNSGLYIEKPDKEEVVPFSWQWYNFLCNSTNPHNTPTQWLSSGFQQQNQLTWRESSGPCINLGQTEQVAWIWDKITCISIPGSATASITWDQTRLSEPTNATWDHVGDNCVGSTAPVLSSGIQVIVKEALIRVLEIPSTAYLKTTQPDNRTSPLTVRLSPKDTVCGSFPIEKIVWDLGDGSPLLVQRRWANTLEAPFVYSGELSEDYQDPRNYDVIHTYVKTPDSGYSFYPSITAYTSSTNSSDCASSVVGPLKLANTDGKRFKLLQNELTDHGKVLIGQVDNNVAVWRADK